MGKCRFEQRKCSTCNILLLDVNLNIIDFEPTKKREKIKLLDSEI